ncbi:MAG: hypothetical protein DHS20C10_01930 [marine bacterium B5-7]|nr:MAG: hypothetical protein DHS20C10_01930 [marine bacterium B5-7]
MPGESGYEVFPPALELPSPPPLTLAEMAQSMQGPPLEAQTFFSAPVLPPHKKIKVTWRADARKTELKDPNWEAPGRLSKR